MTAESESQFVDSAEEKQERNFMLGSAIPTPKMTIESVADSVDGSIAGEDVVELTTYWARVGVPPTIFPTDACSDNRLFACHAARRLHTTATSDIQEVAAQEELPTRNRVVESN